MEGERLARRLSAVFVADVCEYTRHMGVNEARTHVAYRAAMTDVILPGIDRHGGTMVKSTGDGLVAVFGSVVSAAECALAIQKELWEARAPPSSAMDLQFRIGISLGDVIVEEHDVFGDGVNIAARIQELAPPGGVCVTATVWEQVRNRIPCRADSLGARALKNMNTPVSVFRLRADGLPDAPRPRLRKAPGGGRFTLVAWAILLLAIAAAAAGWYAVGPPHSGEVNGPEAAASDALALPDVPSLAVLPFANLSTDPEQEHFADGIAEDLITELSRIRGLFVIARSSSFHYRGRNVKPERFGRELGVRYALTGSFRRSGDRIRLNARLLDTRTGTHLWAQRFDAGFGDIFTVQDEITRQIVSALSLKLTLPDGAVAGPAGTRDVAAYDAFLQGRTHTATASPEDLTKAVRYFHSAVKRDPDYAVAHAALSEAYLDAAERGWLKRFGLSGPEEAMQLAKRHLTQAMIRPSVTALSSAARIGYLERRYDEAVEYAQRAIRLNPNSADAYVRYGYALIWNGQAAEAIVPLEKAVRLDPIYPAKYLAATGVARFALGEFEEAAQFFERYRRRNPENWLTLIHLISAYGHLGMLEEAGEVIGHLNGLRAASDLPPYNQSITRREMPYRYGPDQMRLLVGLERAGVPATALRDVQR